jgi:hypothetical protein
MYASSFTTPSELYSPNAIEGMLVDSFPHDYVTPNLRNGSGIQNSIYSITIGTAASNTDYTVVVNGITATFTSGASATATDVRTGLITELTSNSMIRGLATASVGTDITLASRFPGTRQNLTVTVIGGGTGYATTKLQDALDPKRLPFGRVIATGISDPSGVGKLPQASTDVPRCVSVRTDAHANMEGLLLSDDDGINPGEMINSLNRGRVWMRVLTAFKPSDTVYYAVGGANAGLVRAGASSGFQQLVGARFDSSGNAMDLGVVAVNL